jgi:translation elongation factor EF-Ts
MKTELERLKETIEKRVGESIDNKRRDTQLAFARSVFCKIAREELIEEYSLQRIGKAINRDHSTVIHNINKVFDYAMQSKQFRDLYEDITDTLREEKPVESVEVSSSLRERLNALEEENKMLQEKLSLVMKHNEAVTKMVEGLSYDDVDEVMAKLDIFVKAMRQRTYR